MWSSNQSFAWFDIQIKLPLLLFPLALFFSKNLTRKEFENVMSGYVFGCLLAVITAIFVALYTYYLGDSNYIDLYKKNISPKLHIGYFAMYMNFAILVLVYKLYLDSKPLFTVSNIFKISLLILFAASIFFSTSRNGLIVLLMLLAIMVLYAIISKRKWMLGTMLLLISWVILSSVLKDYNDTNSDFHGFKQVVTAVKKDELKNTEWESSSVRILVWTTALDVIKDNPIIGTGTGDIKDELIRRYKVNEYKYPFERKYNAHNQFLQTAAALGIPAAILLLIMFLAPLFVGWKRIHFLGVFLSIIVGVACLTESVLEVQAGVIFYAFFASLFAQNMTQDYGTNFIDNPLIFRRKQ